MLIHEILKHESPYLLTMICKKYTLKVEELNHSPGDTNDYYDFKREMITNSDGTYLNYTRGRK